VKTSYCKATLLCLLAVLALSCEGVDDPLSNDARVVSLAVPEIRQQTNVWCWAAASEMVLRYYGRSYSQCDILSTWLAYPCCSPFGIDPLCQVAAPDMYTIRDTIAYFGGPTSSVTGPLTFAQIRSEIDAGRPIILGYLGSFAGHVVVIYGYEETSAQVLIHDPYYGTFQVPYAATFTYSGQLVWSTSIVFAY
jgi:hypothetical protein